MSQVIFDVPSEFPQLAKMLIEDGMQTTDVDPEVSVHQSVAEASQGAKAVCQRFWKNAELAQLVDAAGVVGDVVACTSDEVRRDVEHVLDCELQSALDGPTLREIGIQPLGILPGIVLEMSQRLV